MSYSNPEDAEKLFARSAELDEQVKDKIRLVDPDNVASYMNGVSRNRLNLESILSVPMLSYATPFEVTQLQEFSGTITMHDICYFGDSVEQDESFSWELMSLDALQYAVNYIIENTFDVMRARIMVFGVNTCRITDGNEEMVLRGIEKMRKQTGYEVQADMDIFSMQALVFPIFHNDHPACIIILDPIYLLASSEEEGHNKKCVLIEIGTNRDMNIDVRHRIEIILDYYREEHDLGPFIGGKVTYGEIKEYVMASFPGKRYEAQCQLLYLLSTILMSHRDIAGCLERNDWKIINDRTRQDMKAIRMDLLQEIGCQIHDAGTELQRYLYERRIQELVVQEQRRERWSKINSPKWNRGMSLTSFPATTRVVMDEHVTNFS